MAGVLIEQQTAVRIFDGTRRIEALPIDLTRNQPQRRIQQNNTDYYKGMFAVKDQSSLFATPTIEITDGFYDDPDSSPLNCGRIQVNGFMVDVLYEAFTITADAFIYLEAELVGDPATSATATLKQQATELEYEAGYARQLVSRVTFADGAITSFSRENVSQFMFVLGAC